MQNITEKNKNMLFFNSLDSKFSRIYFMVAMWKSRGGTPKPKAWTEFQICFVVIFNLFDNYSYTIVRESSSDMYTYALVLLFYAQLILFIEKSAI